METFLKEVIKKLLGEGKEKNFAKERPLMEMGLDSADLLELSEQLSLRFKRKLDPAFFFQYNSPKRIVILFQGADGRARRTGRRKRRHTEEGINLFRLKQRLQKQTQK